jgi:hypothetical protein
VPAPTARLSRRCVTRPWCRATHPRQRAQARVARKAQAALYLPPRRTTAGPSACLPRRATQGTTRSSSATRSPCRTQHPQARLARVARAMLRPILRTTATRFASPMRAQMAQSSRPCVTAASFPVPSIVGTTGIALVRAGPNASPRKSPRRHRELRALARRPKLGNPDRSPIHLRATRNSSSRWALWALSGFGLCAQHGRRRRRERARQSREADRRAVPVGRTAQLRLAHVRDAPCNANAEQESACASAVARTSVAKASPHRPRGRALRRTAGDIEAKAPVPRTGPARRCHGSPGRSTLAAARRLTSPALPPRTSPCRRR